MRGGERVQRFERGGIEYEMHGDFFRLAKETAVGMENSEGYAKGVQSAVDAFCQKYKTAFAKDLAVALLMQIERELRCEK